MTATGSASVPASQAVGKALLLATAFGWGLNWTVLKFVLQDWPPLFARGTAGLLGALCLFKGALLVFLGLPGLCLFGFARPLRC